MRKTLLPAIALAMLAPQLALAHPHVFADARLEIVSDDNGQVVELRNVWRFDEMFSSSVLMDFDKNTNLELDIEELQEVGNVVRESLADYNYYTALTDNGKSVNVTRPDVINVDYKDGQLLMIFAVNPEVPMALKGTLTFGVYDPTLYTAIDFQRDEDMALIGKFDG